MDRPFRWHAAHATNQKYLHGQPITTLHINVDLDDVDWEALELPERSSLQAVKEHEPSACLAGGSLVFCRGLVAGLCPQEPGEVPPEVGRASIARLPEGLRPRRPLVFAALSRNRADELVALVVRTDGWIQGFGRGQAPGVIDLSAVRFGIDRGISLADEVRLHMCDFGDLRMVMLQGHLAARSFKIHTENRLSLLPKPCRPPGEEFFVVPGTKVGNFHLVVVEPSSAYGAGGELSWADALWRQADEISVSGVVYVAAAEALQYSLDAGDTGHNRRMIVLTEFQDYIVRKYGSIENAWCMAFDKDGSGQINFTEFGFGCKAAGYAGNISRVWALLDTDRSGEITIDELDCDVGVPEVITKLT